jgi:hypothetical protein
MIRWVALLLIPAVLLLDPACGDDGDGDQRMPTATAEVEVATDTPVPPEATDTPHAELTATSASPAPAEGTPAAFTDPFSYCAAVGTIDEPDERWAGPPIPPEVVDFFGEDRLGGHFWRCFEGAVLGCAVGAAAYCGNEPNTSDEPTAAMVQFCQANPNQLMLVAQFGRDNIYLWECQGVVPAIALQMFHVDARGFMEENWFEIPP